MDFLRCPMLNSNFIFRCLKGPKKIEDFTSEQVLCDSHIKLKTDSFKLP